jgi:hypothetical protein
MRAATLFLLAGGVVVAPCFAGLAQAGMPKNMIFFMPGTNCPAGTSRVANANGRMLLVANDQGSIGRTFGTALADHEDRTHKHKAKVAANLKEHSISGSDSCCNTQATRKGEHSADVETDEATSGLPFVQLLACKVD